MLFHYRIYGLRLATSRSLSILSESAIESSPDLTVDLSNNLVSDLFNSNDWEKTYPSVENRFSMQVSRKPNWVRLSYPRSHEAVIHFYIRSDGKKIVSHKPDCIPDSDLDPFLLGPVLGATCRLLGHICLHASVLSLKGKAFALVGEKTAGKSTTAAALLQNGATLIADDVAVLDTSGSIPMVKSAYSGVRLLPESLSALGYQAKNFPTLLSVGEKRFVGFHRGQVPWEFDPEGAELSAIYSLTPRDPELTSVSIKELSTHESMLALLPHSYANFMFNQKQLKTEFSRMAKIARSIPVKSLLRPNNIQLIPEIAKQIQDDFNLTIEGAST